MGEIERTLKLGVKMPHVEYDKGELEGRKLEIRGILGTILGTLDTPLNENPTLSGRGPHLAAPVDPHDTATTRASKSGTPYPRRCRLHTEYRLLYTPACRHLIRHAFTPHELPSLIEAVFSSKDASDTIRSLLGDDAQIFIDVMNEVYTAPLIIANPLTGTDIGTLCRLGSGQARSFVTDPGEMSQIVVQDVWPPRAPSKRLEDPHLL